MTYDQFLYDVLYDYMMKFDEDLGDQAGKPIGTWENDIGNLGKA